ERQPAFSRACERAPPFAVAAVEYQHAIARFQPQHVAEVIGLRRIEHDACLLVDGGVDVEAGGGDNPRGAGAGGRGRSGTSVVAVRTCDIEGERPVNDRWLSGPGTTDDRELTSRVPGFAVLSPNSKGC